MFSYLPGTYVALSILPFESFGYGDHFISVEWLQDRYALKSGLTESQQETLLHFFWQAAYMISIYL